MRSEWVVLAALVGCGPPVLDCEVDADCREAFGYGHICLSEADVDPAEAEPLGAVAGRCVQMPLPARCAEALVDHEPDTLGQAWSGEPPPLGGPAGPFTVLSLFNHRVHTARTQSVALAASELANPELELLGPDGEPLPVAVLQCDYGPGPDGEEYPDGLDEPDAAERVARFAVRALDTSLVIGPASSSLTAHLYEAVAEPEDVLLISPSATSTELVALDGQRSTDAEPGLLWRTAAPDDVQGRALIDRLPRSLDLEGPEPPTLAIIFEQGAYGTSLKDFVTNGLPSGDDAPFRVRTEGFSAGNESSRGIAIADGLDGAEAVLFVSSRFADVAAFLKVMGTDDTYADVAIWLTDSAAQDGLWDLTEEQRAAVFPRLQGTRPTARGPNWNLYSVPYAARFGSQPDTRDVWAPYAFDAAFLGFGGVAWAAATEGESIASGTSLARGLRAQADRSGPAVDIGASGWSALVDALSAGDSIDIEGASSPLDFDLQTGELATAYDVWTPGDLTVPSFRVVATCPPNQDGCVDVGEE